MNSGECNQQLIEDFFDCDHAGIDTNLSEHLESCESCRAYFNLRAAAREDWDEARQMLQPQEYDSACVEHYSVGGAMLIGHAESVTIQNVLDSLAPSDDPQRLGRLGTYEISGVVGVGGMGVVLKAVDPSLDRVVAIKVMAPQFANNEKARRRFSREARAAAAVLHPNVIPIHAVDDTGNIPYLVMAYVRGDSLQKRLDRQGQLEMKEILRIGSQVAAGLAAAHERGLVHRDIKPENILLEGGVERVAITDFGLARAVDDNTVTQAGTIAGTPMFMSPEQARGEQVDQQSDLFSLGSVLYSMCTGQPPYQAATSYGVMRKIIDEKPVPLRKLRPSIPEWMACIVEKLIAHDKSDRFDSAKEVHSLLDRCLGHLQEPKVAEMPSEVQSLLKVSEPVDKEPTAKALVSATPRQGNRLAMVACLILMMVPLGAGLWQLYSGSSNSSATHTGASQQNGKLIASGNKNDKNKSALFQSTPITAANVDKVRLQVELSFNAKSFVQWPGEDKMTLNLREGDDWNHWLVETKNFRVLNKDAESLAVGAKEQVAENGISTIRDAKFVARIAKEEIEGPCQFVFSPDGLLLAGGYFCHGPRASSLFGTRRQVRRFVKQLFAVRMSTTSPGILPEIYLSRPAETAPAMRTHPGLPSQGKSYCGIRARSKL